MAAKPPVDPGADQKAEARRSAIAAAATALSGGRSGGVRIGPERVTIALDVGGLTMDARDALAAKLRDGLASLADGQAVQIAMTLEKPVRRLIAVGSGKGGVGKSTLAANLAVALAAAGRRIGLVDADIYGPSQPRLLGRDDSRPESEAGKLVPVMSDYGVPFLSMGQLAAPGQAIAWRGPMAGKALDQLVDAAWGPVDTLIVDLPPGTGDIQISMLQKYRPAGAVIVSTPQDLALIDAMRAITLFRDAGVPIIGMVENMAGYACPACGVVSDPFGCGGAEAEAATLGLPFLGRVPLTLATRQASDAGVPPAAQDGEGGAPFRTIAAAVAAWLDLPDGNRP